MSTEDRESISADELEQALKEYVDKANASPRAQKTLAGWTCRIHIEAVDVDDVQVHLRRRQGRVAAGRPRPRRGP